jgi:ribosomal protein S12 methylthiotransferase
MRLMYAYPSTFGDDAIDALASLPNVVKYLDIPLQHIADPMLERMRRRVTRAQTETLLEKLRDRVPGIAIRTTFITGFPGETEADHEALVEFVRESRFEAMGVFQYSREEGTPAGTMDLDPALRVPDEVKAQREAELMLAQQENAFADAAWQAEQGAVLDVLIEGAAGNPGVPPLAGEGLAPGEVAHAGRAYHQAPQIDSMTAVISRSRRAPGELVRCVVVGSDGYDLIARPQDELQDAAEGRIGLPVVR